MRPLKKFEDYITSSLYPTTKVVGLWEDGIPDSLSFNTRLKSRVFNESKIKEGTAKKQSPDRMRAKSLMSESEDSYKTLLSFIEKMKLDDSNANHAIKNAYDIIMEMIRAKMSLDGFGTTGKGAHEAEVSYLAKIGFSEKDIDFANELRYFRNGIMYYGKKLDKAYAEKVLKFLKRSHPILKKMCEEKKEGENVSPSKSKNS